MNSDTLLEDLMPVICSETLSDHILGSFAGGFAGFSDETGISIFRLNAILKGEQKPTPEEFMKIVIACRIAPLQIEQPKYPEDDDDQFYYICRKAVRILATQFYKQDISADEFTRSASRFLSFILPKRAVLTAQHQFDGHKFATSMKNAELRAKTGGEKPEEMDDETWGLMQLIHTGHEDEGDTDDDTDECDD